MSSSPGHRKWPEHRVEEEHLHRRMQVKIDGNLVAESDDVIRVEEVDHPDRFYFPREAIRMDALEPSDKTTQCPFKGTAHYFALHVGDRNLADAAWSYEDPFDEHRDLQNRVAFHDETNREIEVRPA